MSRVRSLARSYRADILAVVALAACTAILIWERFWLWNGLAYLDIPTFYASWYAYMGEQLRALNVPGWNPYLFSGTPFAADPQSGWWYFPAMVFFTVFDPIHAYIWMTAFHLLLAGLTTYIYARMIGCRAIAAYIAAFLYEFGPLSNHVSCCLIHVQLAVWIPLALIGVELSVRAPQSWRSRFAGWSLTAFALSQLFAGWVGQGAYYGAVLVAIFIFVRTLWSSKNELRWFRRLLQTCVNGVVTFTLATFMGAAGLLPRLDLTRDTNVSGGVYTGLGSVDYAAGWTVPEMLDKLLSDGHSYFTAVYYLGLASVFLALISLLFLRQSLHIRLFAALFIVTSILTLGATTPVHQVFYLLPRFRELHEHVPMRIVAVQWIAPAMLAGLAVEHLLRKQWRPSYRQMFIASAVPLSAAGIYIWLEGNGRLSGWSIVAVVVLVGAIAGLKQDSSRRQTIALAAVIFVVIWEPAGRSVFDAAIRGGDNPILELVTGPVSRDAIEANLSSTDANGAGEYLQQQQDTGGVFRFFGYDAALFQSRYGWPSTYREWYFSTEAQALLINARPMLLGLEDIQGYNPVQLLLYVRFMTALNGMQQNYHDAQVLRSGIASPLLNLLNVQYIVVPADVPPGRPDLLHLSQLYPTVYRNGAVRVLENRSVLPRAWLASSILVVPESSQLSELVDQDFDPSTTAIVSSPVNLPGDGTGTATVTEQETDEVQVTVNSSDDALLVFSGTFARGWTATVNGEPTKILLTDGVLRGIPVPSGQSTVLLKYEPTSLTVGIWVSVGTFLGVIAGAIVALWSRAWGNCSD